MTHTLDQGQTTYERPIGPFVGKIINDLQEDLTCLLSQLSNLTPLYPKLICLEETKSNMEAHVKNGLTRLFKALDRDQDGYLVASDVGLLGRVMLFRRMSDADAMVELQQAKTVAEKRIGNKKTFQADVLCLEEFLACSWFLDRVPREEFEENIQDYIDAIGRVTGAISSRELVILSVAREQWRALRNQEASEAADQVTDLSSAARGDHQRTEPSANLLRIRSSRALFL